MVFQFDTDTMYLSDFKCVSWQNRDNINCFYFWQVEMTERMLTVFTFDKLKKIERRLTVLTLIVHALWKSYLLTIISLSNISQITCNLIWGFEPAFKRLLSYWRNYYLLTWGLKSDITSVTWICSCFCFWFFFSF